MAQPDSLSALREHVSKIVMVDTHEHLIPEPDRLNADVDVLATFFPHYASSDLKSAGMPEEELLRIRKATVPLEERWQLFEPWWERIRNTGYARAMEIAVRDLYGEDGINADNYADLSGKIKARNKEGLYRWVLRERSGIEVSINDVLDPEVDTEFFAPVHRFSDFLIVKDRKALETLGRASGGPIHTLKSMVSALRRRFDALEGKIVGVKIGLAYMRPIFFDRVTFSEAEEAFNKIYRRRNLRVNEDPDNWKQIPESVAVEEMRPLQDYIIHEMIREAERRRLPVQIHTGLQEGNENILPNSNPEHLINLFMEYKDTKFDIFHGSWPYCGELGALAKNFPNVYIDMCWMHIISPRGARVALSNWLDEVPANKIMGFGGDYLVVEGVYGHAVIARDNIARVLASKVDDGDYTLEQGKKYADWLLRENPMRLFFPEGR